MNQILCRVSVQLVVIISRLGQRVIQNLVEACSHKHLSHQVLQFMFLVFLSLDDKARLELLGHFHIIISIHAKDVFHNVARALDIYTIGGNFQLNAFFIFVLDNHLKRSNDTFDGLVGNFLTDELVDISVLQINVEVGHRCRIHIVDFH